MPKHILTGNCGALGPSDNPGVVSEVQKNLVNLCYTIKGLIKKFPDLTSLIETGNDVFEFAPKYGKPAGTNEACTIGHDLDGSWVSKRRGVSTYCEDKDCVIINTPEFPKIEAVVSLHDYSDYCNGWKVKKFSYFSIYRNTNELADGASIDEIVLFIRSMLKKFAEMGIQESVITGDFNHEGRIDIGYSMNELRDPDYFHKQNSTSRMTRIDRVFTNISHAKIEHVFKSVENKAEYVDENGVVNDDLGHKMILLKVGRDKKEKFSRRFSCKNFKRNAKKPLEKLPARPIDSASIAECAKFLVDVAQARVQDSTMYTKTKSSWKPEELAMDMLEKAGDNIWKRRDAADRFYKVADDFMGKVKPDTGDTSDIPPLDKFKEFHEEKLGSIHNPDLAKCEETMREIHKNKPLTKITFPKKQEFKRIILTCSNSGAPDIFGVSLKQLKILIKHNKRIFSIFYALCKAIALLGDVPDMWKRDKISFLYKNKGTTDNPKYYRPITVACSFGKMFDRVLMSRWVMAIDRNFDNNAYTCGKSCTSAIAEVQNYLNDVRHDAKTYGLNLLTFVCAEDISSAFESIAHRIIELYSELSFECDGFDMPKLVTSYLDRKSFVSDRSGDELLEVYRTFLDQTSPQGSSNSPAWWRVYDGGFTKIFVDLVDNMCENDDRIYDFRHVSYADDKLCCYTLDLDKFADEKSVQDAIKEISGKNREFLMQATSTFGCAVNGDKSEILVPSRLTDSDFT